MHSHIYMNWVLNAYKVPVPVPGAGETYTVLSSIKFSPKEQKH